MFSNIVLCFVLIGLIHKTHGDIREMVPTEAPENLTLIDIDDREVIIKWDPIKPESVRGTFRGYLVRIWNHGATQVYAIPPDVTKTSVQFFPFSKNLITVSVRNDKYVGPRSNAIVFDAPQVEPSNPFLFEWHQMGANSIFLQWSKPTHPNGILLGYNIYSGQIKENGGIDEKTVLNYFVDGPDTFQYKLTGFKRGKKYKVNIGAINCAGESEHNSLEVELEDHAAYAPSIPFFKYKLNYNETDARAEYNSKCLNTQTQKPYVPIDQYDDDYYVLNETVSGRIMKEKHSLDARDVCLVPCQIIWVPDIDNNPGENFYVKYRMKGENEFQKTLLETEKDYLVLENFNACRNYEIILVAVDGEHETESDVQETPAVMFMKKY